jgi:hypothetical protein
MDVSPAESTNATAVAEKNKRAAPGWLDGRVFMELVKGLESAGFLKGVSGWR